jgi:formylglycine-generating enzyme required for sulfatase activity
VGGVFRAVDGKYNAPVTQVTWEGAVEFCNHNGGRLPTEAEWEFVAKGGNNSENFQYSGSNTIEDVAWYAANSYAVTEDVGTKNANQLDIYDMSGNAQEWCSDWYDWEYYTTGNGDNPQGPETGEFRVVRGGSVYNGADDCRSSDRFWNDPKTSMPGLGFRVVK